ncbi:hypothetical protein Q5P01_009228 [Channa striata]|uniref:Uncharacterized protein n=1 Tax=Channa striata TaxID=64152 RepID=A0AA88SX61_CHASR|nr:hypothetical protein Q5P01_009228 [Channa striata]
MTKAIKHLSGPFKHQRENFQKWQPTFRRNVTMSDSSSPCELSRHNADEPLELLNKHLERIIEEVEEMSVQLTLMAYDVVVLRTGPALGPSMCKLEESYQRCRAAVCGSRQPEPERMDEMGNDTEQASSTVCIDLENILTRLDSLSDCMNQLALQTQLKLCDLIVCVGCPGKLAFLKHPRGSEMAAPSVTPKMRHEEQSVVPLKAVSSLASQPQASWYLTPK